MDFLSKKYDIFQLLAENTQPTITPVKNASVGNYHIETSELRLCTLHHLHWLGKTYTCRHILHKRKHLRVQLGWMSVRRFLVQECPEYVVKAWSEVVECWNALENNVDLVLGSILLRLALLVDSWRSFTSKESCDPDLECARLSGTSLTGWN